MMRLFAGTVLAVAIVATSAHAGTFDVYFCDPSHGGGASSSLTSFHADGLTVYGACTGAQPEGIVTRSVPGPGATSNGFEGAFAIFDAPDGTTIDSIHGYFLLHRLGCNWGVGLYASSGGLGGRNVYALDPGYCGTNELSWLYWDWPVNDKRVYQVAICGASSCDRSGESRAAMRNVRVTINDPTPPNLSSPRGSLWSDGTWLAGTHEIAFDASDGAGIRHNDILVDGKQVRAPCLR